MNSTHNDSIDPAPARRKWIGLLLLVIAGLCLRFALAAIVWGTNDANTFNQFGFYITNLGLYEVYRTNPWLNHPPIPALWCVAAWRLTIPFVADQGHNFSGALTAFTPGRWFSAVFKLPALLSDILTAWLLYRIWRPRLGALKAIAVAALYAWCIDAILVSAYHCNTDSIYAALCLLCAYLCQDRRAYFRGGLALSAAINVKLTPILLIPPLLLSCRRWSDFWKVAAALAIGVLPFVPVLLNVGKAFYYHAIQYNSNFDNWGIQYLLMHDGKPIGALNLVQFGQHRWADLYYLCGKYVVLGLIAAWSVLARIVRLGFYETAAGALAIFLFFAPGFGVQYTVIPLPLMFAARPRIAAVYGLAAGLFILIIYWAQWNGHWPPDSQFKGMAPWPSPLWGLAAWGILGYFLLDLLRRATSKPAPNLPTTLPA